MEKEFSLQNVDWNELNVPSSAGERAPLVESIARLATGLSLGVARGVLHANPKATIEGTRLLPDSLKQKLFEVSEMNMDFVDLVDKILSTTTKAVLGEKPEYEMTSEALTALLRLATQFTKPMEGFNSSKIYDCTKAYMYVQHFAELKKTSAGPRKKDLRKPELKLLRRYCRHAMAAYGTLALKFLGIMPRVDRKIWSNVDLIEYLTGIVPNEENLIAAKWRANWVGSLYKPGYYLLLDHENKELILSIRGSYRFQDALTDISCEDHSFSFHYGKSHDLTLASEELQKVATSMSGAINGLQENFRDLTLGEVEENLQATTSTLFNQLQGFVEQQAKIIVDELKDDDESDSEEEEGGPYIHREKSKAAKLNDKYSYINPSKADAPQNHRHVKGRAHFGFLKAAQVLAAELEGLVLDTMRKHKGYQLKIVGHSYGAACSTIISLIWSRFDELMPIKTYAFAAPSSVSWEIATSPLAMNGITSVILADDVVPRLSLGTMSDLRSAVMYVGQTKVKGDEHNRTIAEFVNDSVMAGISEEKMSNICAPIMDTIRQEEMKHSKLYPPGTVWHMKDLYDTIDNAQIKRNDQFDEILLRPGMFHAHLPQRYAYAMCPYLPLSEADAQTRRAQDKRMSLKNIRRSISRKSSKLFNKKK